MGDGVICVSSGHLVHVVATASEKLERRHLVLMGDRGGGVQGLRRPLGLETDPADHERVHMHHATQAGLNSLVERSVADDPLETLLGKIESGLADKQRRGERAS